MSRAPMGPSALYVPKAQLEEWFAHAAPGQGVIYARGAALDARHDVPALVREWIRSGEVVAHPQTRDPVTREFIYSVRRARPLERQADDQRGTLRVSMDEAERETPEGKIYLHLVRCANLGLPCPSNADLADLAGLRDGDAARYVLRKLTEAHRISIAHDGPARAVRRVRISETGRWTAAISERMR